MTTNAEKLARLQQWTGINTLQTYLGIETVTWNIADFQAAALQAKQKNIDVVYVKCGEWGIEWYDQQFAQIRQRFLDAGVGCVPYWFCRPQALAADMAACIRLATIAGGICLDCEEQWIGYGALLRQLVSGIRAALPDTVIIISGYGDPLTALGTNWDFSAIADADAYQPQWYLGYWDVYHQSGWMTAIDWGDQQCATAFETSGLGADFPINPAINLQGVALTDFWAIAQYLKHWRCGITLWEWQALSPRIAQIIRTALGAPQNSPPNTPPPVPAPQPPPPPSVPHEGTYTIQSGDTVSGAIYPFVSETLKSRNAPYYHGDYETFLSAILPQLDTFAQQHGEANSDGGNHIWPGDTITFPVSA